MKAGDCCTHLFVYLPSWAELDDFKTDCESGEQWFTDEMEAWKWVQKVLLKGRRGKKLLCDKHVWMRTIRIEPCRLQYCGKDRLARELGFEIL